MANLNRFTPREITRPDDGQLTFNFLMALPGRASSPHTQRAYYRYVDYYLTAIAGLKPTQGHKRLQRMSALPVKLLQDSLTPQQLRAWLGMLVSAGHGKQGIDQARSSIVVLSQLLAEAGWLDDYVSAAIRNVRPPRAEEGQRPGRWLSIEEIRLLMSASRRIATTHNQEIRNAVITTVLCTMALRREELSVAKWGDLTTHNGRAVLRVHGKGRSMGMIDMPPSVIQILDQWRGIVAKGSGTPPGHTPLLRRLWKGGKVSKYGLRVDSIWLIVTEASYAAGIGHVAPHDLRRSVAGALQEAGVPIDKISRLLRHKNVAITERYLNKLPQKNEGAILMSDMLGLGGDSDNDWLNS
jgi:integrase